MDENQGLAEQFEAHRAHLQAVAYRMLGSASEADDAVQAAWLRLNRADAEAIENIGGWLTKVVARVCLDMLRTRRSRREESLETDIPDTYTHRQDGNDPEYEAMLADSVGIALLVVLDTLNPAERLTFVLHDIFAMPFEEIAPIVERSESAARKLASRARRQVQGADTVKTADMAYQRRITDAFLAASREGSFDALLNMLDPDVVFRADPSSPSYNRADEVHGSTAVARFFAGRARGARSVLVDGVPGVAVANRGRLLVVMYFILVDGKIAVINTITDPARLRQMRLSLPDN